MHLVGRGSPIRLKCGDCDRPDYIASKPCAEVVVADAGNVLLVKRSIEPYLGYWDIPGGFLEDGEHPEDGARREVLEEAGIEVELGGLIGVYVERYPGEEAISTVTLAYAGTPRGEPRPGDETTAVRYFPAGAIPENLAFDHAKRTIEDWRAGGYDQG
jgi:8-oxo-dGTP diphosphatase